jgi:hypothetical protein
MPPVMKNPFADRIAIATAAVGVLLMVFTILTQVNPVEGSVVRPQWLLTPWGRPLVAVLLVTCMPVWFAGAFLDMQFVQHLHPEPLHLAVWYAAELLLQALLYFGIGKLISMGLRKWRSERRQAR